MPWMILEILNEVPIHSREVPDYTYYITASELSDYRECHGDPEFEEPSNFEANFIHALPGVTAACIHHRPAVFPEDEYRTFGRASAHVHMVTLTWRDEV